MKRTIPTWRKYRVPRNLNPKCAQLVDSNKNIVHSIENGQVYKYGVYLHAAESFREANSCSSSLEFSTILWNSSIYYSVRKTPPMVPIHSQINPVHAFPSISLKPIFIISSLLCLCLQICLFPSGVPIEKYAFSPRL